MEPVPHLGLLIIAAAILTLLVAIWRPIVLPRYDLGSRAQPPLGLSWCFATGDRVGFQAGLQLVLPLLPWKARTWCARASVAIDTEGVYARLHLWRRPRRR